ncbi:hypothetical protein GNI_024370 [Gregarina niphandrodes]|uniref:Uncharacterized protein n=1 Tax=Gregarina niphandrodes TaxID=110365 RepID=A0A023BBR4_GRENI|nr:hypothetical protein GNI_024370 [Gregarina niphandrodes]EZG79730.1 hypothetical protein GNI_024370 [Gregarina niphandrodes]|eukprot:XP_011134386.1 hypothetical protein GNI_024370 [Gregarina niphandrodes]
MDTLIDVLFNPTSFTQFGRDDEEAGPNVLPLSLSQPIFHVVYDDCIQYCAISFSIVNVKTDHSSAASAGGAPLLFPSRYNKTTSHLAPISKLCLVAEWEESWIRHNNVDDDKSPKDEPVCELFIYDGFDYYTGHVYAKDIISDKVLVYRSISLGGSKHCQVGFGPTSKPGPKSKDSGAPHTCALNIKYDGVSVFTKPFTVNKCHDQHEEGLLSKYEVPGKFVMLAFKHQLLSWNLNTKLFDAMIHLSKLIDEVTAKTERLVDKQDSERMDILRKATVLINTKKQEIRRLHAILQEHGISLSHMTDTLRDALDNTNQNTKQNSKPKTERIQASDPVVDDTVVRIAKRATTKAATTKAAATKAATTKRPTTKAVTAKKRANSKTPTPRPGASKREEADSANAKPTRFADKQASESDRELEGSTGTAEVLVRNSPDEQDAPMATSVMDAAMVDDEDVPNLFSNWGDGDDGDD